MKKLAICKLIICVSLCLGMGCTNGDTTLGQETPVVSGKYTVTDGTVRQLDSAGADTTRSLAGGTFFANQGGDALEVIWCLGIPDVLDDGSVELHCDNVYRLMSWGHETEVYTDGVVRFNADGTVRVDTQYDVEFPNAGYSQVIEYHFDAVFDEGGVHTGG